MLDVLKEKDDSVILTHNKKHFYKYANSYAGKKILNECSIKVSSALEFNDPFDTFHELYYEFNIEEYPRLFSNKIKELVKNRIPIELYEDNDYGRIINYIILNAKNVDNLSFEEYPIINEYIDNTKRILDDANARWKLFLKSERIFCITEDYNNLLMWAHYSDSHKGIVLRFRVLPELQSAFCAASPIEYSSKPPSLGTFDDMFYRTIKAIKRNTEEINRKLSFTKSDVWKYEKEWRFSVKPRNPSMNYDINSIDEREIDGIYLGCRILEEDKQEIIKLAKRYPNIEIFVGKKNNKEYKLEFEKIN